MRTLLVNTPTGEQALLEVDVPVDQPAYFAQSLVVWDTAVDGPLAGDIVLGGMTRVGNTLQFDEATKAIHDETVLAGLKSSKEEEINKARLAANCTYFMHLGHKIACDSLSRSDIDGTNGEVTNNGAFPSGWPGGWKTLDGGFLTISTIADWKAFYSSMWAQGAANFAKAQQLKSALASATTPEQVAAISW
jgi:hypothetical protein